MLIVTTNAIEGKKISRYFGIVSGEAILGANIFRDLFAGIRDIAMFGGDCSQFVPSVVEKTLRRKVKMLTKKPA
jgi:uncharacterized protein YbjQ (UPF0145 family)